MNFHQAKAELMDGYTRAGLEIVHKADTEFVVAYNGIPFVVNGDDIDDYADYAAARDGSEVQPVECSLLSTDYREHVVHPLDPIRWRYLPPLELGFVFGDPDGDEMYATVGAASTRFVNHFRFDPLYLSICLERMARAPVGERPVDIREGFYRPPTIRVHRLGQASLAAALRVSSQVIDYCLFELSYLKHLPVGLASEWPARRRLQDDGFKFGPEFEGSRLPMLPANFNGDVIQFYQLGSSSRIPVLQFWGFYQVLEYYFVRVSDESLHRDLANRLKDPRFKPTPTQLSRLVQDVVDHMDVMDKTQMLLNVLERYVDPDDVIEFIQAYQDYLGDELYTRRRRVFGEDVQVRLDPDTVLETVARTVIALRQAMVYSPDRFSRTARSVPFDQLTDFVRLEIPLLKFLAERVIIGSAS